ncbi:MAG: hypothetical protein ACOX8C_10445, partial [Saccharomonospora viridis]|uniref:hypothetical protein n=1 Tax=Saccharomonospora viridis TaxID=1852 RepID=UPI003D92DCBC
TREKSRFHTRPPTTFNVLRSSHFSIWKDSGRRSRGQRLLEAHPNSTNASRNQNHENDVNLGYIEESICTPPLSMKSNPPEHVPEYDPREYPGSQFVKKSS